MQKNECEKKKITLKVPFHAGWLEEGDFQNKQIELNTSKTRPTKTCRVIVCCRDRVGEGGNL
jgi:hypothetical protein